MNRIYRVIWNCTLQVFQACSELTRRAGKTSTVNLRKSSGLTTKFSRLTLGVLLALSGSASGASLEVDNDQITNIDTDVAYDAYLVGWYGTGVLNILAGGNASLTTITTSVIGANEDSEGTVNVLGGTWRLYDSGNNARPLNVGQSGTGTLNIKQKGHVDGGYLRLGSSTGGVGTVNVEGEDSVLTTELFEIGSYGTGSLNITDKGYVTSSIVAILGYQAGSNGQVVVEKGGEWLIKNNDSSIEFQIGNQGTGEATIREGGLITAENTIIGGNATGIGTLNVQDQDSVITVRRLYNGYFGNGTLNISNNGLINNKEYSLVGVQDGSHGVVNVTDKGHWNFLGTGEAFRYIYIGDAGDGELNVSNVTGELRNSISGKGIVSATARTDVELDGDNSRFVGQFNIDTGSALSVNEQKNLGDASVINNGLLTISTERSWAMTHSISGSGDVTKLGTGILTLNNDSAAYQGTTDIVGGEIAFGSDSAINMASQHINIHNSGVMSGNVTTAGDVNVMPGGTLRVAKTTIGGNLENGGTVQMNSEGGKPGNVLTVNGNYTGNNGLMTFNATLGGDNSPIDKMNVKGDTQGNTRVRVDNIGGVGAQTVNGIELIEVGGNSAGNFALTTGTVEAGAYVYTLAKGKGNDEKNWYLTSKWDGVTPPDTPDPINNPPVVDPEGPSVYRPEAGSYISNIAAANSLFSHRLHDRLGEPQYIDSLHSQGSASSMWMRHVGGHERSRAGDGQLNTQANRYVLQLGGDLAQWSSNAQDRWHLGVMAGYANQHSNTQSNRVGYKSDGRISGYSAGLYATWYQNDANKTGAYVDSWALYNWFDNSVSSDNRSADDYDSRGVTASVEGGYTFEAGTFSGSEETLNTWYVQPQAQITWMGVKDSDHTRKDGTRIETEGDGNVQTRLGVKTYLNSHHQRDDGKQREFQPYIEANWINNSKVYAVKMNGQTVGREGARNLGEVRTGVEAKVNNNLSLWGNVGVQLGDKGYSDTQGMLGVKYSW
ncbi:autotransporter outer membrane beta-barrel domain-containing protein [Escherichia coli]|nr:autotransporter outer membrane beta-barrel domain-containing protein [Escherichia coli]